MTTATQNASKRELGIEASKRFLARRGYTVLEANLAHGRDAVDIVAKDEDTLVFVSVKTKKNTGNGFPAEHMSCQSREALEKAAVTYLATHDASDMAVRFDVISLLILSENKAFIRHHINAFSADETEAGAA